MGVPVLAFSYIYTPERNIFPCIRRWDSIISSTCTSLRIVDFILPVFNIDFVESRMNTVTVTRVVDVSSIE